jgi:hypothetical protein
VTFANPNLCWLDHPILQADNPFRLSIGYAPDPLEEVFVGEITGVEPSFPNGGMPTIRVTAQDFLHRLSKGTKDRAFRLSLPTIGNIPLPDVVVASMVSATNLLIPSPDPVGAALSVLMTLAATQVTGPNAAQRGVPRQESKSDFDFLTEIARKNGWEMFIDHTAEPRGYVLKFKFLVQDYAPSLTLRWGKSLMEFTPRLTTIGDIFAVTSRVWVDTLKMEFVIAVGWDFDRAAFNLQIYPSLVGDIPGLAGNEPTVSTKATGFPTSLQQILSELLPRLNNRLTGSGSSVGDPRIKAGNVINFEGLGAQFSGLYRITSATHSLDGGGYRTSFQVRKEVWFGSIPLPKGPSGLLRVQGQRIG